MVLQNVIWYETAEETKELYYRGLRTAYLEEKIEIAAETSFKTNTYMNLFDIETWKKYTTVRNIFLELELQGNGRVILQVLEHNEKEVIQEFSCDKKQKIQITVPREWSGKIYFEIQALEEVTFYSACYRAKETQKKTVRIATVICTYKRESLLRKLLQELKKVKFILKDNLEVFVVDNASELKLSEESWIHLYHNPNTGGSGGFGRGMDEVVKCYKNCASTHVLLMDDDVEIQPESLLRLYSLLSYVKEEYQKEIVAGRMFRMDKPWVQYTAAEIWNGGELRHIGFEIDVRKQENLLSINDNSDAEYSGWWFCCIPYEFVKENRPLPFFLHCDDVEYGLRHGGTPIILNGIQVWHETYEYRQSPVVEYYDMRNSLFVNEIYGKLKPRAEILIWWKEKITKKHIKRDYIGEYLLIRAFWDYSKGISWLCKINTTKLNASLYNIKTCKLKNAIAWRYVENKIKKYYKRSIYNE